MTDEHLNVHRLFALTMPAVTEKSRPNELPSARTQQYANEHVTGDARSFPGSDLYGKSVRAGGSGGRGAITAGTSFATAFTRSRTS